MKKTHLFLIVFVVLLGFFVFWVYQGKPFSKEVLKLEILGPEEIRAGEEFEYLVKYKNTGNFKLEQLKLVFECPPNYLKCALENRQEYDEEEENRKRIELVLPDIYPGKEQTLIIKSQLVGEKREALQARAELTFKPKELGAFYSVETTFLTLIKETPIAFEFDMPSQIESGREIELSLNYFSHLLFKLFDLRVVVGYPEDFIFLKSEPETGYIDNEWQISELESLEGGKIKINGILKGETGRGKLFSARLELYKDGRYFTLKNTEKIIEIVSPSLHIYQKINGSLYPILTPGDTLHYEIFFKNLSGAVLQKQILKIQLEGKAFDFSSLNPFLGEFDSETNTIVWHWENLPFLEYLGPYEEGKAVFSIKLKNNFIPQDNGGKIITKIEIPPVYQELETKIHSKLAIIQRVFYKDDVFGNSGLLPPQVGRATTYTVIWQVEGCCNLIKNPKVTAKLPAEVSLTGKIFPEEETSRFFFDSENREVSWQISELNPGENKSLAFQISLSPTLSQKGEKAVLIEEAKIIGEDYWTGANPQNFSPKRDTGLPDDYLAGEEKHIVQ